MFIPFQIIDKIHIHSSPGLAFCLENGTEFCSEIFVKSSSSMNSSSSISLPIKFFAQLSPLKDHPKTIHHKVIFFLMYYQIIDFKFF